jgi:hypothetical protein
MNPETLFLIFGIILVVAVAFTGILVKEIQLRDERKMFDKSDIKYTDGDNT